MDKIELKYRKELVDNLRRAIQFVGKGSIIIKDDIIILTNYSSSIISSKVKRSDIAITENNIKYMAKALML